MQISELKISMATAAATLITLVTYGISAASYYSQQTEKLGIMQYRLQQIEIQMQESKSDRENLHRMLEQNLSELRKISESQHVRIAILEQNITRR